MKEETMPQFVCQRDGENNPLPGCDDTPYYLNTLRGRLEELKVGRSELLYFYFVSVLKNVFVISLLSR